MEENFKGLKKKLTKKEIEKNRLEDVKKRFSNMSYYVFEVDGMGKKDGYDIAMHNKSIDHKNLECMDINALEELCSIMEVL